MAKDVNQIIQTVEVLVDQVAVIQAQLRAIVEILDGNISVTATNPDGTKEAMTVHEAVERAKQETLKRLKS